MDKDFELTPSHIYDEYTRGIEFNNQVNLVENVENNENFYIGKQWEGVEANGLPTPVFNFIKRIVNFQVSSTSTDALKINAAVLPSAGIAPAQDIERICDILNKQFEAIAETSGLAKHLRQFMRDAAVRGDACIYCWFDPEMETGLETKGGIKMETLENTRVYFGNPTDKNPQNQPYIIIEKREMLKTAKRMAKEFDGDPDAIVADSDSLNNRFDQKSGCKVTVLYRFWKDDDTNTIWCSISTKDTFIREPWDTEQQLYPFIWMSWDAVTNCYHGMGLVDGLIPNQVFVNRMFAMVYLSLMTTAYPKIVYDKSRVKNWNSAVGAAIGVNGNITDVAKTIDPATISPQVSQFITMTIDQTKDLMGATDAALGSTRPDNTSAIIALQKASTIPTEIVKQNFYACVEDLARILIDMMRAYYGVRAVKAERVDLPPEMAMEPVDAVAVEEFDFGTLHNNPIYIKLDVGGSSYWSEVAQIQTLDNLLMNGKISTSDYIRRLPSGYIVLQEELVAKMEQEEEMQRMAAMQQSGMMPTEPMGDTGAQTPIAPEEAYNVADMEPTGGGGYGNLQRAINNAAASGQ